MNLYYRIKNTILDFWYNLRCRCQRFKRGYAYSDVWDMDVWFMRTVKPMLIHLKNNGISRPMEFKHRSEWEAVLEEMIDCLNLMDEDYVFKFLGFSLHINQRDTTITCYVNESDEAPYVSIDTSFIPENFIKRIQEET